MIRRSSLLVVALLLAACNQDRLGPEAKAPTLKASSAKEPQGPPAPYNFGPDSYRIGVFTGEGTQTGLDCSFSTATLHDCRGFLASDVDGTRLDVTFQAPAGAENLPLVVLIHGYAGSKTSSGSDAAELTKAGYAVLRYSTRGFGKSWGQVNMSDLHAEIADLRSMIGQIVDDTDLHVNGDAVAITGASYGGGHSWLAAVTPTFVSPKGATVRIRTVIPIAAWTDLLYSLIPNGTERRSVDIPGGLKLSYVNGLYASGFHFNPECPCSNYPDYFIAWHDWINIMEPTAVDPIYSSIIDGLAGGRSIWWQQSFWQTAATTRLPILQIQGLTDDLFPLPEAKRMLLALRTIDPTYPITTYLGDIGHPRANNKQAEVDYVLGLIKNWLAFYLKGEGVEPQHVIYASITRPKDEPFVAENVITVQSYDELSTAVLTARLPGAAVLVNPVNDPLEGFLWDPFVGVGLTMLPVAADMPALPESPIVPNSLGVFEVPVAELSGGSDILIAGQPLLRLRARSTSYRVQLNIRLIDVAPDGSRQLITRGTYTIDTGPLHPPIDDVPVVIRTYGNLWRAAASHRLRVELTNIDSPYITPSRIPSVTEVSHIHLEVPVR